MTCSVPDDRGSPTASEDQQQLCSGGLKHFSEPIKLRRGCALESFMDQDIIFLARRRTQDMRAMNGREDEDPQRQDPPTFGSS